MLLESYSKWLPEMWALGQMACKAVQVLNLMATLHLADEPALFEAIGASAQEMYTARDRAVLPNIAYDANTYAKEYEAVRTVVKEELEQCAVPGQVIAYCRAIQRARRLVGGIYID